LSPRDYSQEELAALREKLSRIEAILLDDSAAPGPNPRRARRILQEKFRLLSDLVLHPNGHKYELVRGPLTYNEDLLATRAVAAFLEDPLFAESYRLGKSVSSWGRDVRWRVYVICWAARRAMKLEGDFVECGVEQGGLSRALINYVDFGSSAKTLYLMDTFCGLVEGQQTAREKDLRVVAEGRYPDCFEKVKETFAPFKNVKLIRGAIPGTLPEVQADQVAYLSIDMNCAAPELAAIRYFWDKLVAGAAVVLDDYGFVRHAEQHEAFDDFALSQGISVLTLPTGQGLILKP